MASTDSAPENEPRHRALPSLPVLARHTHGWILAAIQGSDRKDRRNRNHSPFSGCESVRERPGADREPFAVRQIPWSPRIGSQAPRLAPAELARDGSSIRPFASQYLQCDRSIGIIRQASRPERVPAKEQRNMEYAER